MRKDPEVKKNKLTVYLTCSVLIVSINRRQSGMSQDGILEPVSNPKTLGPPRLVNNFEMTLDQEKKEHVQGLLFDSFIAVKSKIQNKEVIHKINFNFDLIFTLVRTETESQSQLGKPVGLKFQKFKSNLLLECQDIEGLILWKNYLASKLNQRGFHQLFKPIKKIGKGNFASVYLVIKHENQKKYAVKAFSKEAAYSEENGKQSLIKQIQIMRQFNHKNLMKLYEVYQSQNSIYVSVELLEGGQLFDKIKNKYKFLQKQIKIIMKGILEGLEVMHEHNIMHRDLKPQNILMREEGDFDCVIADFGLAQNAKEDFMFVRCGTPGYVAPEVVNLKDTKAKYGTICDLFSVGVIFHLLTMRKPPFPGKEYDDVLAQNRACRFNFETPQYQNLPDSWLNLMKRLLEKDPHKRITATEALNHDFFSKDEMFKEFTEQRRSTMIGEECNSPLMLSKNKERKNKGLTRDDSCLKFKMKQNVMTGRVDQNCDTVQQIDSPANLKQRSMKPAQSRFKRLNHKE